MKKFIAIVLIPVFLLMTAGVAITSLYCNGKISDEGITVKACCKDVNKGGCCDTKTKIVKINDDYIHHSSFFEFNHFIVEVPAFILSFVPEGITVSPYRNYWKKAPPLISRKLFIVFRSIII